MSPRHHSITLSARIRNDSGTVKPPAFAVFRLITSPNLVGCSTGMSAGFTPRNSMTHCLPGKNISIESGEVCVPVQPRNHAHDPQQQLGFLSVFVLRAANTYAESTPRPSQAWGRVAEPHDANASPTASDAVREIRSHLSVFSTILRIYRVGTLPVALTSAA